MNLKNNKNLLTDNTFGGIKRKTVIANIMTNQLFAITVFLFLMIAILSVLSPVFFTLSNIINVVRQISVIALVSFGMTFVILNKGIDLSVGSTVAAAGIVAATLEHMTKSITLSIVCGLLAGIIIGALNGLFIEVIKIPDFIATLGMMSIVRGVVMVYTNADPIYEFSEGFYSMGQGYVGAIPTPVIISLTFFILSFIVLKFTKFGRLVYAVGGNREVSRLAGINVKLNRIIVYMISGFMAAASGILLTSRSAAAVPTAGNGYELDAIAAVVLGGASLFGGKGSIIGTIIGLFILGIISNGLILLGINPFYIYIIKGFILLVAIAASSIRQLKTN